VAKALEELTASEAEQAASILTQESEHDRVNQRIYELDAELKQNQNVLNLTALGSGPQRESRGVQSATRGRAFWTTWADFGGDGASDGAGGGMRYA